MSKLCKPFIIDKKKADSVLDDQPAAKKSKSSDDSKDTPKIEAGKYNITWKQIFCNVHAKWIKSVEQILQSIAA